MRPLILITCLVTFISACSDAGRYPITGCDSNATYPLTCKPQEEQDPVHKMDSTGFTSVFN